MLFFRTGKMNRYVLIQGLGMLINMAASLAVVIVTLALQQWFGAADISSFLFWTFLFAAAVATVAPAILKGIQPLPRWMKYGLLVVAAIGGAIAWIYAVSLVLGPWMGAFSFSLLYPWMAGIAAQLFYLDRYLPMDEKRPRMLRGILISVMLLLGAVILLMGINFALAYFNGPAKETYLIPADFAGEFRVVYGEPCGLNPPLENGRRLLQVPPNGLLILQYPSKSGFLDTEYYWVDEHGARSKAKELLEPLDSRTSHAGVRHTSTGSTSGPIQVGAPATSASQDIEFSDYTVFPRNQRATDEKMVNKREQQLDSLVVARVTECRRHSR